MTQPIADMPPNKPCTVKRHYCFWCREAYTCDKLHTVEMGEGNDSRRHKDSLGYRGCDDCRVQVTGILERLEAKRRRVLYG